MAGHAARPRCFRIGNFFELHAAPFNLPATVNQSDVQPEVSERKVISLLGLLAAMHVFVFSAAFPFFNTVDEQMHFDLVVNYSQGHLPRQLLPPNAEALPFMVIYGTPEFLWTPASPSIPPPPWKLPLAEVREKLAAKSAAYQDHFQNHEAASPPFYYSAAGAWWRLGKLLGLDGGRLLYWVRFLNVPLVAALVWLGWLAAKKVFPENHFIRLAVPALVSFLPQTAFYAINNDIFSPLTFGAAFVLLLNFWEAEIPSVRLAAATGLALAATFLTKISNLPLLVVAGIFIALKIFRLARNGKLPAAARSLWFLSVCAGLPAVAWMAWCKSSFGDFTGSAAKIQFLGWTHKPFAAWFHHPIFTVSGLWFFLKGNLASFWQGELLWHRQPLASPAVDLIYVLLTLGLLLLALKTLLKRPAAYSSPQRAALWFSFANLAALFGFFALLSVKYDFQDCFYPSREHPFFVSGRLLLGALLPFLILFAAGLDHALGKFSERTKSLALTALLMFMLVSETVIDWNIFPNDYNWFHL
jgi:hypothetical protein